MTLGKDEGDLLERYLTLLYAANRTLNLTRVPREQAADRHILESLQLLRLAPWEDGAEALDLGSGGGLPGIPLAVARPRVRFRLLERTRKKARFLEEVVQELGLANVRVQAQDSREYLASEDFRPARYLVSRAAVPLDRLVPELGRLLAPGGVALLLVSPRTAAGPLAPQAAAAKLEGLQVLSCGAATVVRLRRRGAPFSTRPHRPARAPTPSPPRDPRPRG